MMETKILISATADGLRKALDFDCYATVEAEYGDELVEGSSPELTLAHHGPRSTNRPPCVGGNITLDEDEDIEAIGISHLDLDTLGGIMRLLGLKHRPLEGSQFKEALLRNESFWDVVGAVDVRGPHRIREITQDDWMIDRLHAFWAWSESHRVYPPRDGSAADITHEVMLAVDVIDTVLHPLVREQNKLLVEGRNWASAQESLDLESVREARDSVLVRESEKFVNHLYCHGPQVYEAVVAYDPARGTVTLSLANPDPGGVSCAEVAQELWGPEAGGHAGIAGSPRSGGLKFKDATRAAALLAKKLNRR